MSHREDMEAAAAIWWGLFVVGCGIMGAVVVIMIARYHFIEQSHSHWMDRARLDVPARECPVQEEPSCWNCLAPWWWD